MQNDSIYGVCDRKTHMDVSFTERGAKNYATRHHLSYVTVRKNCRCDAFIIAYKTSNGKWKSTYRLLFSYRA